MPVTVSVRFGLKMSSFTAVTVTVPALSRARAAIVSTRFSLRLKSPAVALSAGSTATSTVVASLEGRLSRAVTVLEPAASPIDAALSRNRSRGGASSSANEG